MNSRPPVLPIVFLFINFLSLQVNAVAPKFATTQLKIGGQLITAEVADTDELREHGLMNRTSLPDNHGMLFVFPDPRPLQFWMKDTLIPLSIGFFDREKKLFDVKEMVPAVVGALHPVIYASNGDAMYALEMPKGWFAKNKIKIQGGVRFAFVDKIAAPESRRKTKP